jgi:3-methyladenine DNA glycosylase AlkC
MAPELRDFFDETVVRSIAADLRRAWPPFRARRFIAECLDGLAPLSLTDRAAHIAKAMRGHLPAEFPRVARILERSLGPTHPTTDSFGMAPFKYMPHALIVASDGLSHFDAAMTLQHAITQRFTAEFSIRAFLNAHPDATYARLVEWSTDPSPHVRRLVSEGTRPRLPWAPRLRHFQKDPTPVLALLERLKDDDTLYVRRSVANSLNDIAKDHPDLVVDVCRRWLTDASPDRRWVVTHALRSLVKAGHPGALDLVGAGAAPKIRIDRVRISPSKVGRDGRVVCTFAVTSTARRSQDLLIDYAVHYMKANGQTRPKVFKLKRVTLDREATLPLTIGITLTDLTTRTHYPGRHDIDVLINGRRTALGRFTLLS